jgi:cation transport regulator ChaC
MSTWIFGYGSLIWRPDMPYLTSQPARLEGYVRRFWQGSHHHRGTPDQPGRVVTLIPKLGEACDGMAYLVEDDLIADTFEKLDYREKNGYERLIVKLQIPQLSNSQISNSQISNSQISNSQPAISQYGSLVEGRVYIAAQDNPAFLGDAPLEAIARQISECIGPSGSNIDYLLELAAALRDLDIRDEHVFALEDLVRSGVSTRLD